MRKIHCWEMMQCGRQPGGAHERDKGVCPAAQETRLNGVHGGTNGGRSCWVVSGTMCGGQLQGTFAKKYGNCKQCKFYQVVKDEEYPHFQLSASLLQMLK